MTLPLLLLGLGVSRTVSPVHSAISMAYHGSSERVYYRCGNAGPGILFLLIDVVGVDAVRS